MSSPFHFDRAWVLGVSPERFWETIGRTDEYQTWWHWLREFDANGLVEGDRWRVRVRAPIPYQLNAELLLTDVVPHELLAVDVTGDVQGPARLEVTPHERGCQARVIWDVAPRSALFRWAARFALPLLRWSHDWVIGVGLRQFEQRALS